MIGRMFPYYGSKWRIASTYPYPQHDTIIEPCAGSAGYSHRWCHRQIQLFDVSPKVVGVWDYLINAPSSDILGLRLDIDTVDDIQGPQEAKWLVGFWINPGTSVPCRQVTQWVRRGTEPSSVWSKRTRARIASQQQFIRHWTVKQLPYGSVPNVEATWFVDPPYQGKVGRSYPYQIGNYNQLP